MKKVIFLLILVLFTGAANCRAFEWKRLTYDWGKVENVDGFELEITRIGPAGDTQSYSILFNADRTRYTQDAFFGYVYKVKLIPNLPSGGQGAPLIDLTFEVNPDPKPVEKSITF